MTGCDVRMHGMNNAIGYNDHGRMRCIAPHCLQFTLPYVVWSQIAGKTAHVGNIAMNPLR